MSQSATPVHAVDQDEDVAAAGGLSDRDQRRYGAAKCSMRGYHNRLPKPDSFVLVLTCSNGKVGFVGPLRTEEIVRSWHDALWPDDDLPWSVEPMAAPHA
jgi:hypothetical protein